MSCESDNVLAGAKGEIKYGENICIQPVDSNAWYYSPYHGTVYFLNQSVLDTTSQSISDLLLISPQSTVENGKYTVALDPGIYKIRLDVSATCRYTCSVTVGEKEMLEQDLWFVKCISLD